MSASLKLEERLVVASDVFQIPTSWHNRKSFQTWDLACKETLALAKALKGMKIIFKMESVMKGNYKIVHRVRRYGFQIFADLKLFGMPHIMQSDGLILHEIKPDILTVVCSIGSSGLAALKRELPDTEVIGVTVLTGATEADVTKFSPWSLKKSVLNFAMMAKNAGLDGVVTAPREAAMLRQNFGESMTINTPNTRPLWDHARRDDQNPRRAMTPAQAIKAGATRVIVGQSITRAKNPRDAAMRILDEINDALAKRA